MNVILRIFAWAAKTTYPALERMIAIPPVSKRKPRFGLLPIGMFIRDLNISNDTEYLLYISYRISLQFMSLLIAALFIDVSLSLGIFVDAQDFYTAPIIIAHKFRDISILPCLLLTVAFYIRIRLSIDLASAALPIPSHPAFFEDDRQSNWVFRSSIALLAFTVIFAFSSMIVVGVTKYLSIQQSAVGVSIATLFSAFVVFSLPATAVLHMLIIEKAYRYFDNLREHLQVLVKRRDAQTDKYRKTKE